MSARFLRRRLFPLESLERRVLLATIYVDAHSPGVTEDGTSWGTAYQDLQAALAVAIAGDEVRVADGEYKPTSGADRTISFDMKDDVVIKGGYAGYGAADPDERDTVAHAAVLCGDIGVDGSAIDNSYHVVDASGTNSTAVIDGVTITGGYADAVVGSNGQGGGIFNTGGSPTIRNCLLSGNTANYGGAIFNSAASPAISGCSFTGNACLAGAGGAIDNTSGTIVSIADSEFTSNSAYWGGAIYNRDVGTLLSLTGCTFVGNSGNYGAAVGSEFGPSLTAVGCIFRNNTSPYLGGGVYHQSQGAFVLMRCEFLGNTATAGGGVYFQSSGSAGQITNSAFVGNRATSSSGGGAAINSSASVINCTFVANFAGFEGGGISSAGSAATIANTILWNNSPNAITSGAVVTYSDVQNGFAGTGNVNIDPLFVRNPGPGGDASWGNADDDYGDLQLQPTTTPPARCIDNGSNAAVPAGITTDLAGNRRFIDYPPASASATVDMGAYERQPTLAVVSGTFEFGTSQSLLITFNGAVNGVQAADLQLHNLSNGQDYSANSANILFLQAGPVAARWQLANLPQGNYHATLPAGSVTDSAGNPIATANDFDFFILPADANRDRKVDLYDLTILATNWMGTGKTFSQGDFNYDGTVNAIDLGILATKWQVTLNSPQPAAPAPTSSAPRTPVRTPTRIVELVS